MKRSWHHIGAVVFSVVAVSFGAGAKTAGGHTRNLDVSSAGQDSDGLSLLTQLQQVVTAMASSSTHHVATPEYLSKMEMMASNLAKMSTTRSSPFAGIIAQMNATISNILNVRMNQDLQTLTQKMAAFQNLFMVCETNRNTSAQAAARKQKEIPALASSHTTCRTEEAGKLADMKACKTSLQTSRLVSTTSCDIVIHYGSDESTSLCAPRLSETAEQYNQRMILEFKSRLDTIRSQKTLCQNASFAVSSQQSACAQEETSWQQKRISCNGAQEALDNKACEFGLVMNSTCDTYQSCRSQTMYSYNLANETTTQSVSSVRAEYTTLKRVECLLANLGGDSQLLSNCMTAVFDATHLKVDRSEPPGSEKI